MKKKEIFFCLFRIQATHSELLFCYFFFGKFYLSLTRLGLVKVKKAAQYNFLEFYFSLTE